MDNKDNQKMCCSSGHGCVKKALSAALILLTLFLLAKTVGEIKNYGYIGRDVPANTTITVSGKGEVVAIPDTATVSFSVSGSKTNVSDAQKDATKLGNAAIDFLKKSGIAESDVKTTYYSISPRYDYVRSDVNIYGRQVLTGYEVSQGFEVKIKEIGNAGKILNGLGSLGVQNVSGLTFKVDKEDVLKAEARTKAITDAKTQADKLATELGVRLVRIVNFSEGGNYPIYYAKSAVMGMGGADSAAAPSVPVGENTITSNVMITYEIR